MVREKVLPASSTSSMPPLDERWRRDVAWASGDPGTLTVDYVRVLGPASKATGIDAEVIRRGHFVLYQLATMTSALNATDDSMRKLAFRLLVLKDRFERNVPNADPLAPLRRPEQSLEDVQIALRVVADHHAESSRLRSDVIALLALARAYDVPEARAALAQEIRESRAHALAFRASHPGLTPPISASR